MATLYYTKQIHFTQAQTRIHASYFCVRQESKSVSGNVNEPLHNKDLPLGGHIFKQICCIHLIFMSGDLLVGPAIVGSAVFFFFFAQL